MTLIVMENILCCKGISKTFDLKGTALSRHIGDADIQKVLLDQNFVDDGPIYLSSLDKHKLLTAVWNDTSFLAVSFCFSFILYLLTLVM